MRVNRQRSNKGRRQASVGRAPARPAIGALADPTTFSPSVDAALQHLRDVLAVEPRDSLANHWLALICAYTGHHDEARDAAACAYEASGTTQALGGLGLVEAMAGRVEAAKSILETLMETAKTQFVADSRVAGIHVALGNLPDGVTALRRGVREGDWDLAWARGDARWEPLRGKVAGV